MELLDVLYPKYCLSCKTPGKWLCNKCRDKMNRLEQKCIVCHKGSLNGATHKHCKDKTKISAAIGFLKYNTTSANIIREFKYNFSYTLLDYIIKLIKTRINIFKLPKEAIITPVPLHPKRQAWRGFNQSSLIGKEVAKLRDWDFKELLIRNKSTKPQAQTKLQKRQQNIKGVFSLHPNLDKRNFETKNIVIFDDIITTGSTIKQCALEINKLNPKKVTALSFLIS